MSRWLPLSCLLLSLTLGACPRQQDEKLAAIPFHDDFQRAELGPDYHGDPAWRLRDGAVFSNGTRNRPLWLAARLPDDAVIELDARSDSPDGDIKFEIYGDGEHHASGYILIFGGWRNTISAIARLDEHGANRQEHTQRGLVQPGRTYHMKVVRRGKVIRWYVDGKLFLDYYDSEPIAGEGHDRFAFNDWESSLTFDNLSIRPASGADR